MAQDHQQKVILNKEQLQFNLLGKVFQSFCNVVRLLEYHLKHKIV